VYSIDSVTVHERYGEEDAGYDIALLKLSSDVKYSDAVRPICLPDSPPPEWTNSAAIGWGDTQGWPSLENVTYLSNSYNKYFFYQFQTNSNFRISSFFFFFSSSSSSFVPFFLVSLRSSFSPVSSLLLSCLQGGWIKDKMVN